MTGRCGGNLEGTSVRSTFTDLSVCGNFGSRSPLLLQERLLLQQYRLSIADIESLDTNIRQEM